MGAASPLDEQRAHRGYRKEAHVQGGVAVWPPVCRPRLLVPGAQLGDTQEYLVAADKGGPHALALGRPLVGMG